MTMNLLAILPTRNCLDLLMLAVASLKRFAPDVPRLIVDNGSTDGTPEWLDQNGDRWVANLHHMGDAPVSHALAIEYARDILIDHPSDAILLFDSDAVLLSCDFVPFVTGVLTRHDVIGGLKSRGLIEQAWYLGHPLLHPHCLTLRRELFERVKSFRAGLPIHGRLRFDTAFEVSLDATTPLVVPHYPPGEGRYYPGTRVTEYFLPGDPLTVLWAHLGRGTVFRPRGPFRERVRRWAAWAGSARARKICSYQEDRQRFIYQTNMLIHQKVT